MSYRVSCNAIACKFHKGCATGTNERDSPNCEVSYFMFVEMSTLSALQRSRFTAQMIGNVI